MSSVSGPDGLRRSVSGSVSGPGAALRWAPALCGRLCVRARRSLCGAPALSLSGPGSLCVRARRSVSGPGALLSVGRLAVYVGALCRARLSVTVCVVARRSSPQAPVSASGPGTLCVRRSLCRGPALFVSVPSTLCRALSVSGPRDSSCPALSVLGPGRPGALCVGPSQLRPIWLAGSNPRARRSAPDPRATHPAACHPSSHGSQPRSACHIQPRAPSSDPRATHPAGRSLFQERTPNLPAWGTIWV